MFFIYLGKNGCGKTHKLNEESKKVKENKIFFPCASEILSMIDGKQNKNCLGENGTKDEFKNYDNPIITLIKLISNEIRSNKINSEGNTQSAIDKISDATNEFQDEITKELEKIFNDSDDDECDTRFKKELIKSYIHYDIPWYSEKNPYISFFDILNKNNKFSTKSFSHGQLTFSMMKFCFKMIEKYQLKLSLFFDEPDNYLNPELINELVDLMSSVNDCSIYISSHNPYFISHLLNKVKRENIELYRLEAQSSPKRESKCQKIKISEKQYIVPSLLIYEIYKVYTIDLLDFYIGEIEECHVNNSDKKYYFTSEKNDKIVEMDKEIKRVDEYFKKGIDKPGCIENNEHKHYSIINLVRNYYHHPSDREIMQKDIDEKMNDEYKNIEILLKCAIENIRDLLKKNNCTTYKLDYEDCNN